MVQFMLPEEITARQGHRVHRYVEMIVKRCNPFFVTLVGMERGKTESFTMRRVDLNYDNDREILIIELSAV